MYIQREKELERERKKERERERKKKRDQKTEKGIEMVRQNEIDIKERGLERVIVRKGNLRQIEKERVKERESERKRESKRE